MATDAAEARASRRGPRRTREYLLDAAERVVLREGPSASMNAIAAEAGISKPILYRHFGDKAGLYVALADRHIETLLALLREALTRPATRRERTEAAIDAWLRLVEGNPALYRFLVHRGQAEEPEVRDRVAIFQRRLGDALAIGIAAELGLPEDQWPRAQAWAHGIVGMVQAASDWWLDEQPFGREDLTRHLADLIDGAYAHA
ncbi:TetR family transcriptional regulator [Catenulispora rubra]|uniref:TetR family transcriptional regulator n=1 Tax=Catenulispora rubra TaxID=280293 RepID=UPI0018922B08|nr:TetR family transcriptional regulator [Catenulispora rubra]